MVQSSAAPPIDINADVDADTRLDADDDALDLVFAALSDRTRRNVLGALTDRGEGLSVSELAQPHGMSLTGFMKHLRVLEDAGLLARTKEGRVVRCELAPAPLQEAAVWLSRYEKFWNERLDALGRYLYHRQELTPSWPDPNAKTPASRSRRKDAAKSTAASNPRSKPPSAPRSASNASTRPRAKKSGAPGPTRKR
jgi:DNA-binding transcriptional ArsR family regulator